MTKLGDKSFNTRTVHAGERLDLDGVNPVVSPIHPSVGYTFTDSNDLDAVLGNTKAGYVYSTRYANPTVTAFETAVANLEGAETAHAFSSGMAAIHMALLGAGVRAGTTIVAAADVYGATHTLLGTVFDALGAKVHLVDVLDLATVRETVAREKPVAVLVETISNPLMKVADLPRLVEIAHGEGSPSAGGQHLQFSLPLQSDPIRRRYGHSQCHEVYFRSRGRDGRHRRDDCGAQRKVFRVKQARRQQHRPI